MHTISIHELQIKKWRAELILFPGGPVGIVLHGPRGERIYLPPVIDGERISLPKYVHDFLKKNNLIL